MTISATNVTRTGFKRLAAPVYGFKVLDAAAGIFSAFVAVFGNVDLENERILPGAFGKSLDAWRASGDPIPVIFSHQWGNLASHVGVADPNDLVLLAPGDARLPAELKSLGALWVKAARLDIDEDGPAGDQARALFRRLSRRSIKEFSVGFTYDEVQLGEDGVIELVTGGLIEFGPTLKGMNPATALVGTRSYDPAELRPAIRDFGEKVYARLRGSDEERRDALQGAAREAFGADAMGGPWVCVEAVFDDYVVVSVEPYDAGELAYWQLPYAIAQDGTATLGAGTPIALSVTITPTTVPEGTPAPSTGVTAGAMEPRAMGLLSAELADLRATKPDELDRTDDVAAALEALGIPLT